MKPIDRREFSTWMPALLALGALLPKQSDAQSLTAPPTPAAAAKAPLHVITSGVYKPGPPSTSMPKRSSRKYLVGTLTAGNLRLEIHQSTQQPGAEHEAVGTHLHNEIWLMKEGACDLTTNGVTRRMEAGDIGICAAGDLHYVQIAGDVPCTYFVVTVGPPEPA